MCQISAWGRWLNRTDVLKQQNSTTNSSPLWFHPDKLSVSEKWNLPSVTIAEDVWKNLRRRHHCIPTVTVAVVPQVTWFPSSSDPLLVDPLCSDWLLSVRSAIAPELREEMRSRAPHTSLLHNTLLKRRKRWRRKCCTISFYRQQQGDSVYRITVQVSNAQVDFCCDVSK